MLRFLTHYIPLFLLMLLSYGIKAQTFEPVATSCPFDVEVAISEPNCQGGNDGSIQLRINTDEVKANWVGLPADVIITTDQKQISILSAGTYSCQFLKDGGCSETIEFTVIDPVKLRAEANNITVCDDGSAVKLMKSITGGRPPYKFDFQATDNIAVPVCLNCDTDFVFIDKTTNFNVTIKDSRGCVSQRQVKIEVAPRIEMQTDVEATRCAGEENGTVFIASNIISDVVSYTLVGAGDTPAVVQEDPEFENLEAGQYTVIAEDANGCTEQQLIQIEEPDILELAELQVADISCPGETDGGIKVSAKGGNENYRYSLDGENFFDNNIFRNLSPGNYDLYVQDDKGCSISETFTVTDKPIPALAVNVQDPTCPDEEDASFIVIIETVEGLYDDYDYSIDGVTFKKDSIFKELPAGEYNLIARSNTGCTFEQAFQIAAPPEPTLDVQLTDPGCPGEDNASFIVIIETVEGLYEDFDYSIDGVAFQKDSIFKELPAGDYNLIARSNSGCTFEQAVQVVAPVVPDLDIQITDPGCPGEDNASFIVIIETVEGLYEDFDYSINGGLFQKDSIFKELPSGKYNVTARSNSGCTFEQQIEVAVPDLPDIDSEITPPSCPGGDDASFIVIIETVEGLYNDYEFSLDAVEFQPDSVFYSLPAGDYNVTIRSTGNNCTFVKSINVPDRPNPTINIQQQDANCPGSNDASFIVIIETVEGFYQYSLDGQIYISNNEFTNLESGDYTVYVQNENGCVFTQSIQLNEPESPTFQINVANISCNGDNDGNISVSVSGGIGPFKYSIDGLNFQTANTFENLPPGIYTITIEDANGCHFTQVINVSTPDAMQVEFTIEDASCGFDNGFIASTVMGGSFPYLYNWNDNQSTAVAKDLIAGKYSVTIEDANGCKLIQPELEVMNEDGPVAEARTSNITCNGEIDGSIELEVKSNALPLNYKWSNGENTRNISGLKADLYIVTITDDNQCANTYEYQLEEPADLEVMFSLSQNLGKGAISTSVNGGTAPYQYLWSTGETTDSIGNLAEGNYVLVITDKNGCNTNKTIPFKIEVLDDVRRFIELYPNPARNELTIDFTLPEAQLISYELIDELGRILIEKQPEAIGKDQQYIDLTHLSSAMYFLRMNVGTAVIVEKVLVIR